MDGVIGTVSEGVFSTDGEVLVAFDLESGAELWRAQLEPGGGVSLAAGEGVACAERPSPRGDAVVQCFSSTDGTLLWSRTMERTAWIAIAGGLLVLAGGETVGEPGWVAVDPATGATAWKKPDIPIWDVAREQESDLLITCDSRSGDCLAVQASDGSVIWQASVGEKLAGVVVRSRRLVIFAPPQPSSTSVYVLDIATGARRGTIVSNQVGVTGFCSGPAISRDLILLYGCGGFLLTYQLP
jgi:outer membrane protein assembly factor BamB